MPAAVLLDRTLASFVALLSVADGVHSRASCDSAAFLCVPGLPRQQEAIFVSPMTSGEAQAEPPWCAPTFNEFLHILLDF